MARPGVLVGGEAGEVRHGGRVVIGRVGARRVEHGLDRPVGPGALVHVQAAPPVGVRHVVAELAERGGARQIGLAGRQTGRRGRQRVPEAEGLRPGGRVASHGIVGVGDPEGGRAAVGRQGADVGGPGAEAEVAGDQVPGLRAVLQEVAVPQVVMAHVALDPRVVAAVHGDAAVEASPHAAAGEVLPIHRPHHVPVHRISGQQALLSHEPQGHAGHAQRAAHPHDVPAEPVLTGGAVAPDHDVAGEQADLRPLVHRHAGDRLQLAVVSELERLGQRHAAAAHRGDGDDLRVVGIEVGRGHHQPVTGAPVGRLLELQLGGAGGGAWRRAGSIRAAPAREDRAFRPTRRGRGSPCP